MRADPYSAPVDAGAAETVRRSAFGLPLELDARLASLRLPPRGADAPARRPTRVRIDPDGVERAWAAAAGAGGERPRVAAGDDRAVVARDSGEAAAVRVGALRVDGRLLLAVDAHPRAGYLLTAPGRGRALVSPDGLDVRCDPEPDAHDWAALVPAQVLPLAATLRGLEVVHAAGVLVGSRVLLLAGDPGAGKTSLAAALALRGATLLSDDAVALERHDATVVAHPGSGVLQLRPDAWARLTPDARHALRPSPDAAAALGPHARRMVPEQTVGLALSSPSSRADGSKRRCAPPMAKGPAPVGAVCLLERAPADGAPALERLPHVDPFALLATTFNLSVRTPARLARHLDLCAALAADVPIHRLRVQPGVDATALAAIVLRELEAA